MPLYNSLKLTLWIPAFIGRVNNYGSHCINYQLGVCVERYTMCLPIAVLIKSIQALKNL